MIGTDQIMSNAVQTTKILNGAVTAEKMSLSPAEICVTGAASSRQITGRRLCALSRVPNNVQCHVSRSGSTYTITENPPGPNNCCMFCF